MEIFNNDDRWEPGPFRCLGEREGSELVEHRGEPAQLVGRGVFTDGKTMRAIWSSPATICSRRACRSLTMPRWDPTKSINQIQVVACPMLTDSFS